MAGLGEKVAGAIYGGAIGDAMGAPVEGWSPEGIRSRFKPEQLTAFLPPTHKGDPSTGKGDGRVTDDTLMAEALIGSYVEAGDHLDAYGYERFMIPRIGQRKVWVPERQCEMALFDRLWLPEKFPYIRLYTAHADPRQAGVGNCVNCGVAMWMWPAGAVNPGDPVAAYQEGAAIGLAHNESFAVEAGAVMAAAAAAALAPGATIDAVIAVAVELGRDATALAVRSCTGATDPADGLEDWIRKTRAAMEPYDQRTRHESDDATWQGGCASDVGKPSRMHAIEETPVALAALKWGGGDWLRTLQAGVFYGRDCDSIAGMAGSLFGALFGVGAVPEDLRRACDAANRRDFGALAGSFSDAIKAIAVKDRQRFDARQRAVKA